MIWGLLLIILDDGWYAQNSKISSINIAMYDKKDRINFIKRCKEVLGITPYEIGIKRVDLTISAKDCKILLEIIDKYNMFELDVVKKKFSVLK